MPVIMKAGGDKVPEDQIAIQHNVDQKIFKVYLPGEILEKGGKAITYTYHISSILSLLQRSNPKKAEQLRNILHKAEKVREFLSRPEIAEGLCVV